MLYCALCQTWHCDSRSICNQTNRTLNLSHSSRYTGLLLLSPAAGMLWSPPPPSTVRPQSVVRTHSESCVEITNMTFQLIHLLLPPPPRPSCIQEACLDSMQQQQQQSSSPRRPREGRKRDCETQTLQFTPATTVRKEKKVFGLQSDLVCDAMFMVEPA